MSEKYDKYQEEMAENPSAYGTPDSYLLKLVREQGFKPIGITTMMCEETFIFKGSKEASEAWEKFKPEGWWYGLSDFWKDWDDYLELMGEHDKKEADSVIHWLDENYRPR
jgi:hypothetical protein